MAHPLKIFLSHNSADKPQVENIALRLNDEGFDPWLDKWDLVPGETWQEGLEKALKTSDVCLIFIGKQGQGPWHTAEMRMALNRNINQLDLRVIPVLLPDAAEDAIEQLPDFLQAYNGVRFYQSLEDENAFRRLVSGIKGERPGPDGDDKNLANPYRGLQYFDIEHADFFFGRDTVTQTLLDHIQPVDALQLSTEDTEPRFLAVIGASGSGKSSLVRAGLLASLEQGVFPGSGQWPQLTFKPGERPLQSLAVAINTHDDLDNRCDTPELIKKFRSEPLQLHYLGLESLHGDDDAYLLILVDQFEEVFSLCHDWEEREAFLDNLLAAATDSTGRSVVVLTMRADFYANCSAYPQLSRCLERQQYLLNPMDEAELREAIVFPARRMGFELELGLVELIVKDVQEQPGTLPLLQYALMQLWEQRQSRTLRLVDYQKFGGLAGALEQRANQIYAGFSPELQEKCRLVFRRLVQPSEGTIDTRRRSRLDEFEGDEGAQRVIRVLTNAKNRLLTTDRESGVAFIEVSHESLIRGWKQLQEWIDEDREQLRLQHQIIGAARDWEEHGREDSWLWTGARLLAAEEWLKISEGANDSEQQFVESGLGQRDKFTENEIKQKRRLQWLALGATLFGAVMLWAASIAFQSERKAQEAQIKTELALSEIEAEKVKTEQALSQVKIEKFRTEQALSDAEAAKANANKNAKKAKDKELLANFALAKALEEKAISAIQEERKTGDTRSLQAAWLYALKAESLELPEKKVAIRPSIFGELSLTGSQWISPQKFALRNTGQISALAYSPNGKILATSGKNYSVQLWNADNGERLQMLHGHVGNVIAIAYTPDGGVLASASMDKTIRLWNISNGKLLAVLKGHKSEVSSLAFGPKGRMLASGSWDKTIRIWDIKTGKETKIIHKHDSEVSALIYNLQGNMLVSGHWDNTIRLWDINGEKEVQVLNEARRGDGTTESILALTYIKDENVIVSGGKTARLWDIKSGKELKEFKIEKYNIAVGALAFNPNDNVLAISTLSGNLELWDIEKGERFKILRRHKSSVYGLAYSPDGKVLTSGSWGNTIRFWNIESKGGTKLSTQKPVFRMAFNPKNNILATSDRSKIIQLWDADKGEKLKVLKGHEAPVLTLDYSPDGKILASAGEDNKIRLWDSENATEMSQLNGHRHDVHDLAFDASGKIIASAGGDKVVRLWDIKTGRELSVLQGHKEDIYDVTYILNGKVLTSASRDSTIRFWSPSGSPLNTITGHGIQPALAYSPDGKIFAFSSGDRQGLVRLWDLENGREHMKLEGHNDLVVALAYSPDGLLLASGSWDKTIRLWDTRTGELLKIFQGHSEQILSLAYSPNGKLLASSSTDNTIRLWKIESSENRLLFDFDPKEVLAALSFIWELEINVLDIHPKSRHPELDQSSTWTDETRKYRPLLDMPSLGETKLDQLVRWLEERKAYRKTPAGMPVN